MLGFTRNMSPDQLEATKAVAGFCEDLLMKKIKQ